MSELKWDYPLTSDEIEILKETGVAWCNERLFAFLCEMALASLAKSHDEAIKRGKKFL